MYGLANRTAPEVYIDYPSR